MVNLSGGPMKVHEDQRGFRAISEIYQFSYAHREYLWGDHSAARIALLYSQDTLTEYGRDDAMERYVEHIRGMELAMNEAHIPYDILSVRQFRSDMAQQYDVILLANMAVLTDEQAEQIRGFADLGGSVIATYETSLYRSDASIRDNFLLHDLFGADYLAHDRVDRLDPQVTAMAYQELDTANQDIFAPLNAHFEGTSLLPAYGRYLRTKVHINSCKALTYGPAMQVFPEGFAYPLSEGRHDASIVARKHPGGGSIIYFTGEPDRAYWLTRALDFRQQLLNAIAFCEHRSRPLLMDAPKTVLATLREKDGHHMVHLINSTGGDRYFDTFIPVFSINMQVFDPDAVYFKATCLSDGRKLELTHNNGYAQVTLDKLTDYEVIRFE